MVRHDWVFAVSVVGAFLLALGAVCILLSAREGRRNTASQIDSCRVKSRGLLWRKSGIKSKSSLKAWARPPRDGF
jgi:hypothetical protein